MLFDFFFALKRIKVFALVGESGTGKSFRAKLVAHKYGIEYIIDDGLLIKDSRIIAGHSAKKEKSFMAAVKVALFDDKKRRDEIARKLQSEKIKKLLLLGTSEKMVCKIAARLQIPQPKKIIKIEDIATQDEIDKAIRTRRIEGKHIIPVPAIEIKRAYPTIFHNAMRIFMGRRETKIGPTAGVHEKSVVRPSYSKRGRVIISEAALSQMVIHCVDEYSQDIRIKKILVRSSEIGYNLAITVDVPYGTQLGGNIHDLQRYVIDNIERYTGILIEGVNIIIDRIIQ
ncbi:MAG: hypothetical protein FWE09_06110 [Treponema sp.]|nr:hypothetical protein [Treponema sp.]